MKKWCLICLLYTSMGMVELMNEAESGAVNGNAYDFTIASAVDEVSPKLVKGETDIAAVPARCV